MIKNFISKHIDFKVYGVTWIAFALALAMIPALMYMPQKWGWENGIIENIQMVVLWTMIAFALTAKKHKRFFKLVALIITIIVIREVNCGRTLFFHIPGTENAYYRWKDIKYGYLAHPLYGAYIATVALIAIKNKFFIDLWEMIKTIKFPFWNILLASIATFLGAIAEKATNNNFIFEEGFELLFYVSLFGIIYLYSRHKNF
ncbi:hypothetical protein IJ425_02890 [bacterium]|nr:hypothetical protein [bacterium]